MSQYILLPILLLPIIVVPYIYKQCFKKKPIKSIDEDLEYGNQRLDHIIDSIGPARIVQFLDTEFEFRKFNPHLDQKLGNYLKKKF